MHFAPRWTAPPAIVAEALTTVPDPLLTALRPGPPATAALVAASLAKSLMPAEDGSPAPLWLLDAQQPSFRRTLAAVRRYGGAILADPVGSGKTYIALAVAATFNLGSCTACLVPATLLAQWEAAAKALNIPVALCSHQQASRGRLPPKTQGMVIIDESHHFRSPMTKRYGHVAAWLVNRPALMVTATPIVNRLSDLASQLLLAVRDNALVFDGITSLRALLGSEQPHPALGQLVVENDSAAAARPRKITAISRPTNEECNALEFAAGLISRLSLSRSRPIASLIRGVMLRAAGSSPAAFACSLQRYRKLLLHARDARRAGHELDRRELRHFTAELGDQLVWWELLPADQGSSDIDLDDLVMLEEVIPSARAATEAYDAKLNRLQDVLGDDKPSLIFTASRDTVTYIRERLDYLELAWCTGDRAGIGRTLLSREAVLGWFRESVAPGTGPRHLIVTDVAAEGLDLQRAARVVHYDLPWTPMRLEQREGRSARLGSRHAEVYAVRFAPPPVLEQFLRLEATLTRKAKLPPAAGLGEGGRHLWRWRADLAKAFRTGDSVPGVARVSSTHRGLLAGIALYLSSDPGTCMSATVGWLDPSGGWTEDAKLVTERLMAAGPQIRQEMVDSDELRTYVGLLTPLIRNRLALTRGRNWCMPHSAPCVVTVVGRLGALIRQAARLRQENRLMKLESALAFVAGGHTAGEKILLERLAEASDQDLMKRLSRVIPQTEWKGIDVRLTGLIVFGPANR